MPVAIKAAREQCVRKNLDDSFMNLLITPSFEDIIAGYQNTAEDNDRLFHQLTSLTWSDPILGGHRRHVEDNKLGYGDAAFHAMWLRLLDYARKRFGQISLLEIGVFKGQVISLWALIGRNWDIDVRITAITPFEGRPMPRSRLITWIRSRFDFKFRENLRNGNFYENCDYEAVVKKLFGRFDLDFWKVRLCRGYSTDSHVQLELSNATFHIVYVDGDHSFDGALQDFKTYGPKVVRGGWLVADDAGSFIPGSAFWKGHEAVSRAVNILPEIGFRNVLNVGHNRIFERV
ncbi:MAG: class I SAM-dependent methyltransferase [Rhizobiales bacterium]|nr:class I SAM-dependent methyltransferase [Hyphomicrobiales bacterium]